MESPSGVWTFAGVLSETDVACDSVQLRSPAFVVVVENARLRGEIESVDVEVNGHNWHWERFLLPAERVA